MDLIGGPASASERQGHLVLHMEATHANDTGALTLVSVAAPDACEEAPAGRGVRDAAAVAKEHLTSLRRLRGLVDALVPPSRGAGAFDLAAAGSDSCLLLLAPGSCEDAAQGPAEAPSLIAAQHAVLVARECFRLRDERDSKRLEALGPEGLEALRACAGDEARERLCILPSPPESERQSWASVSPTPSERSSPGSNRSPLMSEHAAPGPGEQEGAARLLQLLRRQSAAAFEADAWRRRVEEEGRPPELQVQDLLGVISNMQQAHHEVVELSEALAAGSGAAGEVAPQAQAGAGGERLRWSQGLMRTFVRGGLEASSPALHGSTPRLLGLAPGAPAMAAAPRQMVAGMPPILSGGLAIGSPRWSMADAEPKMSPSNQVMIVILIIVIIICIMIYIYIYIYTTYTCVYIYVYIHVYT